MCPPFLTGNFRHLFVVRLRNLVHIDLIFTAVAHCQSPPPPTVSSLVAHCAVRSHARSIRILVEYPVPQRRYFEQKEGCSTEIYTLGVGVRRFGLKKNQTLQKALWSFPLPIGVFHCLIQLHSLLAIVTSTSPMTAVIALSQKRYSHLHGASMTPPQRKSCSTMGKNVPFQWKRTTSLEAS